jgi:preprotein translocase subunit SecA
MNKQRESVYALRRELLEGQINYAGDEPIDTRAYLMMLAEELVEGVVGQYADKKVDPAEWDLGALRRAIVELFGIEAGTVDGLPLEESTPDQMAVAIYDLAAAAYTEKEEAVPIEASILRRVERDVMLQIVDAQWKDHLYALDHLKEGIGLRGYGQKDPLIEYKKESFEMFQDMMDRIEDETIRYLFFLQIAGPGGPGPDGDGGGGSPLGRPKPVLPFAPDEEEYEEDDDDEEALVAANSEQRRAAQSAVEDFTRNIQRKKDKEMAALQFVGGSDSPTETKQATSDKKAGRNDPCPCGSGKKYKKCHGA